MASRRRAPAEPLRKQGAREAFRGDVVDALNRNYLKPEEVKAFLGATEAHPFWGPYFWIQYTWGCRVSEPALLSVNDVSLDQRKIVITRLKKNPEKSEQGFTEHVHAVPGSVVDKIAPVLAWRQENNREQSMWLFPSSTRRGWKPAMVERLSIIRRNPDDPLDAAVSRQTATRWFHKFADEAKIPQTLRRTHILRHTRATLLYARGASSDQVKRWLGHAFLSTTERYIHVAEEFRQRYEENDLAILGIDDLF